MLRWKVVDLGVAYEHWVIGLMSRMFTNGPGGARGVMVIVTGYGHGDTSSIPGQDWLHFT